MMSSYLIAELIAMERRHALERVNPLALEAERLQRASRPGARARVASTLVRLAICLDDRAGRTAAAQPR
jgi:hypothetical protein